jgi:hypothetical protein
VSLLQGLRRRRVLLAAALLSVATLLLELEARGVSFGFWAYFLALYLALRTLELAWLHANEGARMAQALSRSRLAARLQALRQDLAFSLASFLLGLAVLHQVTHWASKTTDPLPESHLCRHVDQPRAGHAAGARGLSPLSAPTRLAASDGARPGAWPACDRTVVLQPPDPQTSTRSPKHRAGSAVATLRLADSIRSPACRLPLPAFRPKWPLGGDPRRRERPQRGVPDLEAAATASVFAADHRPACTRHVQRTQLHSWPSRERGPGQHLAQSSRTPSSPTAP